MLATQLRTLMCLSKARRARTSGGQLGFIAREVRTDDCVQPRSDLREAWGVLGFRAAAPTTSPYSPSAIAFSIIAVSAAADTMGFAAAAALTESSSSWVRASTNSKEHGFPAT